MLTQISKKFLLLILMVLLIPWQLFADVNREGPYERQIVGSWHFYKVFYQGSERPPFNPNLQLYFQFDQQGQSRILYFRTGEKGFCERKGHYYLDEGTLVDKVTWVNSKNAIGCGQDPDMRLGNETRTKIDFQDGDFHLFLSISGEPLIYIWESVDEIPSPPSSKNIDQ